MFLKKEISSGPWSDSGPVASWHVWWYSCLSPLARADLGDKLRVEITVDPGPLLDSGKCSVGGKLFFPSEPWRWGLSLCSGVRESRKGWLIDGRAAWSGPGWGVVLTHGLAVVGAPVSRDPVRSQDLALPPTPATSLPTLHLLACSLSYPGHTGLSVPQRHWTPSFPDLPPQMLLPLPRAHSLLLSLAGLSALSGSSLVLFFFSLLAALSLCCFVATLLLPCTAFSLWWFLLLGYSLNIISSRKSSQICQTRSVPLVNAPFVSVLFCPSTSVSN